MKYNPLKTIRGWKHSRIGFFILGLAATLWFILRVIPKPSRAGYPCMKAAAPLMSAFVLYLIGTAATVLSFRRFLQSIRRARYVAGSLFLFLAIGAVIFLLVQDPKDSLASLLNPVEVAFPAESNQPVGEARGLFPGRVIWVHDPDATNENYIPRTGSSDHWYSHDNADETVIKEMLELALLEYAEAENAWDAWDAIFRSFNKSHGRGDVAYKAGEKIAFKINLTNQSASPIERPTRMDATPQLLNAILDQLINVVGVDPGDITMGDPYREFRTEYQQLVMSQFPDVVYVDGRGQGDVYQTVPSLESVIKFSDGDTASSLPEHYLEATYLINIPCLKTHDEGGITLIAKNHQGSYLERNMDPAGQSAYYMHYSLPKRSRGEGKYRHTVDYMGHEHTGGKGLIYIIDGIWAGESWQGWIQKYKSEPFNDDYPSSILLGQDPVALESVCFDILYQENVVDPAKNNYPIIFKTEISDLLCQYASSDYWPEGIVYDPEQDGTPLESLGVYEHWNNPTDRQYSRNLGTGEGIELIYRVPGTEPSGWKEIPMNSVSLAAPNPFTHQTRFLVPGQASDNARLDIYDTRGALVRSIDLSSNDQYLWDGSDERGKMLPGGIYIYCLRDMTRLEKYSGRVVLSR